MKQKGFFRIIPLLLVMVLVIQSTEVSAAVSSSYSNENAQINTASSDTNYTGLQKINGKWMYLSNGKVDKSYVGLAKNEFGWWYVKNGTVDFTYTGMAKNDKGWFYVKKGKVDLTYTGLADNQYGTWYMVDGKVASSISGLTKVSKVWMYLSKGKVDTSYVGLAKNESGWWYVENGTVQFKYTGMAKNQYGWWYVTKGQLDRTYTGLATNEHGTWYMVDGKLASDISGLTKVSKKWMYLSKGKVDTSYVGLAKNESGWWYVKNGTVDFTYTGMAKNQNGWWYVTNGKLDRTYTGLATNEYGVWYMTDGKLDLTYDGEATYNGKVYIVSKGKVVSERPEEERKLTIKILVDQIDVDSGWIMERTKAFSALHPTWEIEYVYETGDPGNAANTVLQDPSYAADVFAYTSDLSRRLIDANIIASFSEDAVSCLKEVNSDVVINTITVDGKVYGAPYTSLNLYMYYDKSVYTEDDIKNLDKMLAKKKVAFPLTHTWFSHAFYIGNGCSIYGNNGDISKGIDFSGQKAIDVTKYLIDKYNSGSLLNKQGYELTQSDDVGAFISGRWEAEVAKEYFGENMGVAVLPTYTLNGENKQMYSFVNSYAYGVNVCSRNYDKNADVLESLAMFLGSSESQLKKYECIGTIPTSQELLNNPLIKEDELAVSQMKGADSTSIIQPNNDEFNYSYWHIMDWFTYDIIDGYINEKNVAECIRDLDDALNGRQ